MKEGISEDCLEVEEAWGGRVSGWLRFWSVLRVVMLPKEGSQREPFKGVSPWMHRNMDNLHISHIGTASPPHLHNPATELRLLLDTYLKLPSEKL